MGYKVATIKDAKLACDLSATLKKSAVSPFV